MKDYDDWTSIYYDVCPVQGKLFPYLRLIPDFMSMDFHGISFNRFYDTKQEAVEAQEFYNKFFTQMMEDYSSKDN